MDKRQVKVKRTRSVWEEGTGMGREEEHAALEVGWIYG